MTATNDFTRVSLSEAWIDGEDGERWRSAVGHGPEDGAAATGSSLLEVDPGCGLGRHTDSAEEVVVVVSGVAEVQVGDAEPQRLPAGGIALIPEMVPHVVRNAGEGPLRFVALYAGTDVVTTYERPVQPGGSPERHTIGGD